MESVPISLVSVLTTGCQYLTSIYDLYIFPSAARILLVRLGVFDSISKIFKGNWKGSVKREISASLVDSPKSSNLGNTSVSLSTQGSAVPPNSAKSSKLVKESVSVSTEGSNTNINPDSMTNETGNQALVGSQPTGASESAALDSVLNTQHSSTTVTSSSTIPITGKPKSNQADAAIPSVSVDESASIPREVSSISVNPSEAPSLKPPVSIAMDSVTTFVSSLSTASETIMLIDIWSMFRGICNNSVKQSICHSTESSRMHASSFRTQNMVKQNTLISTKISKISVSPLKPIEITTPSVFATQTVDGLSSSTSTNTAYEASMLGSIWSALRRKWGDYVIGEIFDPIEKSSIPISTLNISRTTKQNISVSMKTSRTSFISPETPETRKENEFVSTEKFSTIISPEALESTERSDSMFSERPSTSVSQPLGAKADTGLPEYTPDTGKGEADGANLHSSKESISVYATSWCRGYPISLITTSKTGLLDSVCGTIGSRWDVYTSEDVEESTSDSMNQPGQDAGSLSSVTKTAPQSIHENFIGSFTGEEVASDASTSAATFESPTLPNKQMPTLAHDAITKSPWDITIRVQLHSRLESFRWSPTLQWGMVAVGLVITGSLIGWARNLYMKARGGRNRRDSSEPVRGRNLTLEIRQILWALFKPPPLCVPIIAYTVVYLSQLIILPWAIGMTLAKSMPHIHPAFLLSFYYPVCTFIRAIYSRYFTGMWDKASSVNVFPWYQRTVSIITGALFNFLWFLYKHREGNNPAKDHALFQNVVILSYWLAYTFLTMGVLQLKAYLLRRNLNNQYFMQQGALQPYFQNRPGVGLFKVLGWNFWIERSSWILAVCLCIYIADNLHADLSEAWTPIFRRLPSVVIEGLLGSPSYIIFMANSDYSTPRGGLRLVVALLETVIKIWKESVRLTYWGTMGIFSYLGFGLTYQQLSAILSILIYGVPLVIGIFLVWWTMPPGLLPWRQPPRQAPPPEAAAAGPPTSKQSQSLPLLSKFRESAGFKASHPAREYVPIPDSKRYRANSANAEGFKLRDLGSESVHDDWEGVDEDEDANVNQEPAAADTSIFSDQDETW